MEKFRKRLRQVQSGEGGLLELVGPQFSGRTHLLRAFCELAQDMGFVTQIVDANEDDISRLPKDESPSPQLIAIDNVDALSSSDMLALKRTVRRTLAIEGQPMLWVCVRDLDPSHSASWDEVEEGGITLESVRLHPLSLEAVVTIMKDQGLGSAASRILGRRLHTLLDGSPGRALLQVQALYEAGWLTRAEDRVTVVGELSRLRDQELPLSEAVVASVSRSLAQLDEQTHDLVVLLALFERPVTTSTLAKCLPHPEQTAALLEHMETSGLLQRDDSSPHRYALVEENLGRVARQQLSLTQRQATHQTIAHVLSLRRRRSIGVEVARHRDLAGQPGQAYLDYLAACLRAERARHFHDVITWTRRAQALEETALTEWEGPEGLQAVRTVAAIRGRALLATGRTEEACHQLERSLDPAWGPAPEEEIARTRALLGEGWARMGRADRAIEHLKEALRVLPEGAPECPSAIGRLTQLRLLKGELHAAIETVEPAVNRARDRDLGGRAEASLNRRLASARAVEGRLVDARLLLEASDFALRRSPHEHLEERAILLCDLGDLDLLAGRYARAISHAEQALELCSEVREVNRVCAAYAILSVAYWRIGQGPKAAEAAERMALYLQGEGAAVWRPRLHTARVLLGLGRTEQAKRLLSTHQPPPDDQSFGTRAWWRALGARCVVDDDPTQAESAAQLALDSLPIGAASALDLLLDVSEAFLAVGKPEVCVPVLQGRLEAFRSENATGLLLEATVMLHRLDAPSLDRSPCATWVEEIRRHLHGPTSPAFLRRPDLIEVLEPSRLEG